MSTPSETTPISIDTPPEYPSTPLRWIFLSSLPLAVGVFLQRFGEIFFLTRLDRVLDPYTTAMRGFDFWNPFWDMGAVQFQQVGYWIPSDIWFSLSKAAHLPVWLSERIFIYALLVLALWGFVRLADALHIGRPVTRIFGGVAYAISPVILSRIGWQSPFAYGVIFLPWALVPLVRGSLRGSTRRAAAQSAVALTLVGGANAAITFAVLPIPLFYLLTRSRGPRRASLIRWWLLAVPLATLWWLVGLVLFTRYAPNVLEYSESAQATTGPTSIFEVLRGTADWTSRLAGPANPAGFSLTLETLPVVATAIVAGFGLAGLALRKLPDRFFLISTLLLGTAAVSGGYGEIFGNPGSDFYRTLLDGVFNAFRNIYKFQALIALPLALGICHLLNELLNARYFRLSKALRLSLFVGILGVFCIAATPLWRNSLTRGPGFTSIPTAWTDANTWLSENSTARALIVPGIPDGHFEWGFTQQIPIQWGSNITWATRSQVPLSGTEIIDYLDGVELAIERGGDPALPDYLRRGGFSTIVVPNDQVSEMYGAPSPESVRNALIASGFTLSASFGERRFGYGYLQQIDIYEVPGGTVAKTYPEASSTWLSGSIRSTLSVPTRLFGERPFLLARDSTSTTSQAIAPAQWIITDGNQATTTNFGFNRNNQSYIHTDTESKPPFNGKSPDQTTLTLGEITSVEASSVGPGIFKENLPAVQPVNAIDGRSDTWWEPFRFQINGPDAFGSSDPWIKVAYSETQRVDHLEISLYIGPFATLAPIDVTVRTDAGLATTRLLPIQTRQVLDVVPGDTHSIEVSIARSSFAANDDVLGIRELTLPQTPVVRRLAVPAQLNKQFSAPGSPDPAWIFTRNQAALSPLVSLNSETQISRLFAVPKDAQFQVLASASPTRGQQLLQWLGSTPDFTVSADSTWNENPKVGPRSIVDGLESTSWRSGSDITPLGGSALITMRWNGTRTLSSLRLQPGEADAMPTDIVIFAGNESRGAPVDSDGTVTFAPLTTNAISIRLNYAPWPVADTTSSRFMGFKSIDIPAIADLYPGPLDRSARYTVSCGSGPAVSVASMTLEFSANISVGELIDGAPLELAPCESDSVGLKAGTALLDASSGNSLLTINQIAIGNQPTMTPASDTSRAMSVDNWGTNDRTVTVAGGEKGLLVVNETFNRGWEATLNGESLDSLKIDGWRQAFVLPKGDGGTVRLFYAPDRVFKIGTAFGLFTLLAVIVLALWPDRRKRVFEPLNKGKPAKSLLIPGVLFGAVWCTGMGAVLLLPALWLRNRRWSWLPLIAFISMSSAGILAVIGKRIVDYPSHLWGAASYPVTALAAIAFLCALVTLIPRRLSKDPLRATDLKP